MSFDLERVYGLLPAIYRIQDTEQGRPLKELLAVIQGQMAVLEEDLAQLYDDQFIETCADWVVPYIGDLIGYRPLYGVTPKISSPRAEVANTIGYRRRKGTVVDLEQMARDVTAWPARAVEFFLLLTTTHYLNHVRPDNLAFPDMRRWDVLQWLNTPFDSVSHTLDIRSIEKQRGRYNIPDVGIFLWRLQPYPVTGGTARQVQDGCYTFDPLGVDIALFRSPPTLPEFTLALGPSDLPEPLRRRPLYADLEALRQGMADGRKEADLLTASLSFGKDPVFQVLTGGTRIDPSAILICDLSTWQRPPDSLTYAPSGGSLQPMTLPIAVAVDPVLGRLAFPVGVPAGSPVQVNYFYGFSADMGGGQYARSNLARPTPSGATASSHTGIPAPTATVSDSGGPLSAVLTVALSEISPIVELEDSTTYNGDIVLPLQPDQQVILQARDEARPVINGSITITAAKGTQVILDGLVIAGQVQVSGTAEMSLILYDCTVRPWHTLSGGIPQPLPNPAIGWADPGAIGSLILERCITGRCLLAEDLNISIADSIVDALQDSAVALAGSDDGVASSGLLNLVRTTVVGTLHVREIDLAENSIISGTVVSERKQKGCVRFCYLPDSSATPRRYECQPDRAIGVALDAALKADPGLGSAAQGQIAADVRSRIRPTFGGGHYGEPGYGQLDLASPGEIRMGADDGAEMGAFHDLYQPQRDTNLRTRLDEYLRFGLEASIFYAT